MPTHYLYYFNDAGELSRVDWPPRTVSGSTVWDNYLHGSATIEATLNDTDLTGGSDLTVKAGVVLGGATGGTSIWVAGTPYEFDGFNYVVWRIDATDLTTVLDGPNWLKDNNQIVHLGTPPDYGSVLIMTGSEYESEALIGWAINDTNHPSLPHVCETFSSTSGHKYYSSLDGLATFIDSVVLADVHYDSTMPCPNQHLATDQWINWDRMQGVWTTNDGHMLFVWVVCRTDADLADDGTHEAAWNASAMHYDIYARLDSDTALTVTRIARSPGTVFASMFTAGWGNNLLGYNKTTNQLHCYLTMDMDATPWPDSLIYHAVFDRSAAGFTLADDWVATTINQADAVSIDGSQLMGGTGNWRDDLTNPNLEYFSVDHGANWALINTDLPGTDHTTPSWTRWYENPSGGTNGLGGDWAYTAMARILPAAGGTADRVGILVNWEADDDWLSHAVDDVTPDAIDIDLSIVAANPRIEVDTLTVTLRDTDGQYVPARTTSTLYPNVRLAREMRWNLTVDGTTECRFHGTIAEYQPRLGRDTILGLQECQVRAESPMRALASCQVILQGVPSGVLVNPDGVTGVIPAILALVPTIIPVSTWALDPTPDSIDAGFLTAGMTVQTALEQCALFADSIYCIRPHYRVVAGEPKFYFVWKARGITHAAFADHTWTVTGGSVGTLVPRYTGDII